MSFLSTLNRSVIILGIVSLFNDVSSEMIYPLLPLFLAEVLGASTSSIGIIEGVAESTSSILKMLSGYWTDKIQKRKPFVFVGYFLTGIVRPLIALAQTWPVVLLLRFIERAAKGIRSAPRDALIADVTDDSNRGLAFGIHRSMDHAGAVAGPLLSSLLLSVFALPVRSVFWVAAIPGILAVLLVAFGVKEPTTKTSMVSAPTGPANWSSLGGEFKFLLGSIFLFTLGNSTDAFIIIKLSKSGLESYWITILWALHNLIKMLSTLVGGRLADRLPKRYLIVMGWALYSAVYFCFALFDNSVPVIIIFLVYGVYYGIVEPAEKAYVAQVAPPSLRGSAFGFYHLVIGLGALPASLLFGWIWQSYGSKFAFLCGGSLALAAAGMIYSMNYLPIARHEPAK